MVEAPNTRTDGNEQVGWDRLTESPPIQADRDERDVEPPSGEEKEEVKQALTEYDMSFVTEQLREDGISNPEELEMKFRKYIYTVWARPNEDISPSEPVDAYWHKFVLNTEEYIEFCNTVFECYMDHIPFVPEEGTIDSPSDKDEAMPFIEPDAPYRQTHTHES